MLADDGASIRGITEWDGAPGTGTAVYDAAITAPAGTVTVWLPSGMPTTRITITIGPGDGE
jgi:hypothetical protein